MLRRSEDPVQAPRSPSLPVALLGLGLALGLAAGAGCGGGGPDDYDLDFDIPRSEAFAPSLSAYGLYRAPQADLQPADGVLLYELASELFTDYAFKQRLMKVPAGQTIQSAADGGAVFPEGTVLVKTFYYPADMRDPGGARRIIETRLLVKRAGTWNVATYLWNEAQTDATLLLEGTTTDVSWLDEAGAARSTNYAVPHEGECVTCHQSDGASAFIGPTLRNLNRMVTRGGNEAGQLAHLQAQGVLEGGDLTAVPVVPNYKDAALPLETRARAYLDINCAHCHNPAGWDGIGRNLDFRYQTPLAETGIVREGNGLVRQLESGEMPYLGTTLPHEEGIRLVADYIDGL